MTFEELLASYLRNFLPEYRITESNGVIFVAVDPNGLRVHPFTRVAAWMEDNLIRVEELDDNGVSYGEAQFDGIGEREVASFIAAVVA